MKLLIQLLKKEDAHILAKAFAEIGWNKPVSQFLGYYLQQQAEKRTVFVAWLNGGFAGYVTIVWKSKYAPFRKENIPEIVDLNVLPKFQRQRIGSALMNAAEKLISKKSKFVGIGVGLAPGYEAAQRMYVRRGYVPDGNGVSYNGKKVRYGQMVTMDDHLVLYFTKNI